jgi:Flavodoxin
MQALVIFESIYGNTRAIAEAVAEGLRESGEATVRSHDQIDPADLSAADVLVVGAPTHMHGLPTNFSREMAAKASEEEGAPLDPCATAEPGIRSWLSEQSGDGRAAAAFDTRADKSPALTGSAARGIGKRLRRRGFQLGTDPESFFVDDAEGPLADGELERARDWGRTLANSITSSREETSR